MNVFDPPKVTKAKLKLNFQAFTPGLFLVWEVWSYVLSEPVSTARTHGRRTRAPLVIVLFC